MRIIKNNIKMIGIVLLSLTILLTSINKDFETEASTIPMNEDLMTNDTFEGNGGEYSIEHILSNYNVFSFSDASSVHLNGPVIVKDKLMRIESLDGRFTEIQDINNDKQNIIRRVDNSYVLLQDGSDIREDLLNPSYIGGEAYISNIYSPEKLYLGTKNVITEANNMYSINNSDNFVKDKILVSDSYIDWDVARENLQKQSKLMLEKAEKEFTKDDIKLGRDPWGNLVLPYIEVNPGEKVKVSKDIHDEVSYILYNSDSYFDEEMTIINYEKAGLVQQLPMFYVNPDSRSHSIVTEPTYYPDNNTTKRGINIINNYPNAKRLYFEGKGYKGTQGTDSLGHVIAVQADYFHAAGNTNGGMIVNGFYTHNTELHMWPLSDPIALPKTVNLNVTKTWLGKIGDPVTVQLLADGNVQEEIKLSNENQWHHTFTNLKEKNNDGQVINYKINEIELDQYDGDIIEHDANNFEIVNKNYGKTSLTVTKEWLGTVGEAVKIDLLADDVRKETIELNEINNWTHTFENLPEYSDTSKIQYTVSEHDGEKYAVEYKEVTNGFQIINDNRGFTDIEIQKTWLGLKGKEAKINLLADSKVIESVVLNEGNGWQTKFEKLPKLTNEGKLINYEVEELDASQYNPKIVKNGHKFEIINTNLVNKDIEISKEWIGKAAGPVQVELLANDVVLKTIELSQQNDWKHLFTDLFTYDVNGNEIEYSVNEIDGQLYNVDIVATETGFKLTNMNHGKTHVDVRKTWKGVVGEPVEIELLKNDVVDEKVVLGPENKWSHRFDNLPLYDDLGNQLDYTVQEVNGDQYNARVEEIKPNEFEIINTNLGIKNIKVNKKWIGHVEGPVTIKLFMNGNGLKEVLLGEDNIWTHTFKNLEKYNDDGTEAVYTIQELKSDKFIVDIIKKKDVFDITNTNLGETTVEVSKEWNGKSEKSVEIELLSGSKTIDKVTLNDTNKWTYTFENLDKYSSDGQLIEYRVREVNGKQFDAVIEEYQPNKFKITNTNLGETTVNVKKTWVGKAENEVEINLLANGIIKESIVLNNENSWKYTFEGLEKYDTNGLEIGYSIEEVNGDKYNVEIKELDKNNYEITNYNQGSRSIKIDKIWDGKTLDGIEIDLVADGKWLDTFTLNDDNHWSLEVNNLPIYDEDGNFIEYTIVEKYYENYTSTLSGDVDNGFVITNKEIVPVDPVEPEAEDPKEVSPGSKDPDTPNDEGVLGAGREPQLPSTGMGISANLYLGGLLTIIGLVIKRKNKH